MATINTSYTEIIRIFFHFAVKSEMSKNPSASAYLLTERDPL